MILVDTCILIDVLEGDSQWGLWSTHALAQWSERGPLLISPIIFSEWSALFANLDEVESAVRQFDLTWQETPKPALFLAAQVHKQYRRRGGGKPMGLPDFLIGAHAAVNRTPLLTRDRRRFTTYFANLEVVSPD